MSHRCIRGAIVTMQRGLVHSLSGPIASSVIIDKYAALRGDPMSNAYAEYDQKHKKPSGIWDNPPPAETLIPASILASHGHRYVPWNFKVYREPKDNLAGGIFGSSRPTHLEHIKTYEAMNVRLIISLLADDYGVYEKPPYKGWLLHTSEDHIVAKRIGHWWDTNDFSNRHMYSPQAADAGDLEQFRGKESNSAYNYLRSNNLLPGLPCVRNGASDFDYYHIDRSFCEAMIAMKASPYNGTMRRMHVSTVDGGIPPTDHMLPVIHAAKEALQHGNVLVHCWMGWGRTGRTVGAILSAVCSLTPQESIAVVEARNPSNDSPFAYHHTTMLKQYAELSVLMRR